VFLLNYNIAEKKINKIVNTSSNVLEKVVEFLYINFKKYNWVGIYIVDDEFLILGPWRGKFATEHTKIPIGKGICGAAAKSGITEVVYDVSSDDRYLSCFASTKSEIVIPIKKGIKTIGEIDIDSDVINAFTVDDKIFLEKIADMLAKHIQQFQHSRSSSQRRGHSERVRSSQKNRT
jgi:GAF domain-containing protein